MDNIFDLRFDELISEDVNNATFFGNYKWEDIETMDAKTLLEDVTNKAYGKEVIVGSIMPAPNEILVKSRKLTSPLSVKWTPESKVDYSKVAEPSKKKSGTTTTPGVNAAAMHLGTQGFVSEQIKSLMELSTYHAAAGGDQDIIEDLAKELTGIDDIDLMNLLPVVKGNWAKRSLATTTTNKVFAPDESLTNVEVKLDALKSTTFDDDEAFDFGSANITAQYIGKANAIFENNEFTLPLSVVDRAAVVMPEKSFRLTKAPRYKGKIAFMMEEYKEITDLENAHSVMLANAANYLQELSSEHDDEVQNIYTEAHKKLLLAKLAQRNQARITMKTTKDDEVINYQKQTKHVPGYDTDDVNISKSCMKVVGKRLVAASINMGSFADAWWRLGEKHRKRDPNIDFKDMSEIVKYVFDADFLEDCIYESNVLKVKSDTISWKILRWLSTSFRMPLPSDLKDLSATIFTAAKTRLPAFNTFFYRAWLDEVSGNSSLAQHVLMPDAVTTLKNITAKTKDFVNNAAKKWHLHYKTKWKGSPDKTSFGSIQAQNLSRWFKHLNYDIIVKKRPYWFGNNKDNPLCETIRRIANKMDICVPPELNSVPNYLAWADTLKKWKIPFVDMYDTIDVKTSMLYDDTLQHIASLGGLADYDVETYMAYDLDFESITTEIVTFVPETSTYLMDGEVEGMGGDLLGDVDEDDSMPLWPDMKLAELIAKYLGYEDASEWFASNSDEAYWGSEACMELVLRYRVAQGGTDVEENIDADDEVLM